MRARVLGYAFGCFGLVSMSPAGSRHKEFVDFIMQPGGAMLGGVVLVTAGLAVEESGTMARIRAGIGLRLGAVGVFVVALLWGLARDAPSGSSSLGWGLIAGGGALVAYGARFDLAAYRDPRHGRLLRLDKVSPEGIVLIAQGRQVRIPVADVTAVAVTPAGTGRGVVIAVRKDAGVRREGDGLPWVMTGVDDDRLFLTEHEAGLDASVLAARIEEAAGAAKGFR